MKAQLFFKRSVALLLALCTCGAGLFSQYHGSHFISDTSFFKSFTQAVDSLKSQGVNGALTFWVLPGVYENRLNIENVSGTSNHNPVTFKSYYGDSSQVVLRAECKEDSNYVVRMGAGCNNFNFEGITLKSTGTDFGKVVFLDHYPQYISFSNCVLSGVFSNPSSAGWHKVLVHSTNAYIDFLTFENNLFEYGSTGLYLHGNNNSGGEIQGINIRNNEFVELGYQGITLHNPVAPVIEGNTIQCYDDGITLSVIYTTATVTNNVIFAEDYGISTYGGSVLSPNALIGNNFIHIGENGERGISLGGGTGRVDIFHNTILTTNDYYRNYGMYFGSNTVSPRYDVQNNIIACLNGGSPLYIHALSEIDRLDYNAYYSPGNFFAFINGQSWVFNLEDFTSLTGFDQHSYMAYPYFMSETDLHSKTSWYNGSGNIISRIELAHDIDGELRSTEMPDIGADEYTPEDLMKYNGAYTIGTGGYFANFDSAIDSLKLKGVSGNVSLEFLRGEYIVQSKIPSISGTSTGNILTITSQNSDAESVLLQHDSPDLESNYIFCLDGTDFIKIQDLGFYSAGDAMYATSMKFRGGQEDVDISGNKFYGSENTNNRASLALFYSTENYYRDMEISGNRLDGCAHGIYFQFTTNSWPKPHGIIIDSNEFANVGYSNIYLQRTLSPVVTHNNITSGYRGIQLYSTGDSLRIVGNKIAIENGHGIYMSVVESTEEDPGLIANNFVSVGGVNESSGLYMNNSNFQKIYHNSFNISSTHATRNRALYLTGCDFLSLNNNIFSNPGGGYCIFQTNSNPVQSDYNAFYTTGSNVASIEGTLFADLHALHSATGFESNSLFTDPIFFSATDLHLADDTLAYAGTFLTDVPLDIDGENRDSSTPSIGADEYAPFENHPPYVVKPIPDKSFMINPGTVEIALLDTVFIDDDIGDQLDYSAVSDNVSIVVAMLNTTLQLQVETDYSGQAEVVVTATDLYDGVASDTFLVTILEEENTPPVAVNDTIVTAVPLVIRVLNNDYDSDGDVLTLTWVGAAQQGTATSQGDTAIYYDPAGYTIGADTVHYAITDGNEAFDTAMVLITIPLPQEGFYITEINLDSVSHGSVAWGDYDADGDLDLLMTGWLGTYNDHTSKLYKNVDGNLIDSGIEIQAVSAGSDKSCAWTDFNNDGLLDFIITGTKDGTSSEYYTMIYKQSGGTFTPVDYNLHKLTSGSVDWGDYDHDGDYDLMLSGKGTGSDFGGIYRNMVDESDEFVWNNYGIEGKWNSVANFGDFDKDGDLDLLLSGWEGANSQYRNDSMAFSTLTSVLNTVDGHSADVGDYDMDGDLDIVMNSTNNDTAYSCVYRCEDHDSERIWSYSLLAYIQDIKSGTVAWGDCDNDGDLDFITSGTKTGLETYTVLYENPEGFAFTPIHTPLPNLGRSAAAWGDYDNDHDLDLVLTGFGQESPVSIIVRNDRIAANTPPTPPTGLLEDIYRDKANLVWLAGNDAETKKEGLTYNIRMGSSPGASDIISPLSLPNGYRQVPKMGNAGQALSYMVYGLEPATTYYWSVQAVDNNFEGSPFAPEKSFTTLSASITNNIVPDNISIYPNPTSGKVYLKAKHEIVSEIKIEIVNEAGLVIINHEIPAGWSHNETCEFELKETGIYFLRVITSNNISISKVVRY